MAFKDKIQLRSPSVLSPLPNPLPQGEGERKPLSRWERGLGGEGAKLKWCALTCLAMLVLSLMPQIHLWVVRGREWNGAYVSPQGDEPLYSAYINALIDGRSRRNDPYGARDDSPQAPLPESAFSIQFVPAYAIALPARIFGISASTAFIVLIAAAALLGSISVFWLLNLLTGDHQFSAAGTLFVLCFGCIVGRYGIFGGFLDIGIPALHFLRRYQPAASFPLFFLLQILVWHAFTNQNKRIARVSTALAGLTLATVIFSYLYLWTAAAAWLACISAPWFYFRPSDRRKVVTVMTTIGSITALALLPYAYLLAHRAVTLDEQQTLSHTHAPDLLRAHEILGAVILFVLVIGVSRRRIKAGEPQVIYAVSLALLPFVVFNQQVVSGRLMQAFHFEIYVVNYSTLVALLILISLFWQPVPRRLLIWMAALSFAWGTIVVGLPARLAFVPLAIANDKSIPVLLRLKQLSREDGTFADLQTKGQASTLVFSPSAEVNALLPTWTSQGTLLDVGGVDFGSVTREERKKFFYLHLYYSRVEADALRKALNDTPGPSNAELSTARSLIFGHERITPALGSSFKPVQEDEIERETQIYQAYINSFSRAEALKRPITYAVIPVAGNFDFTNLDRWYERDAGERVGDYTLYRVRLRD